MRGGSLPGILKNWSTWSPLIHAWGATSRELPFPNSATAPGIPISMGHCMIFLQQATTASEQLSKEVRVLY